jgi:hypothetical protein
LEFDDLDLSGLNAETKETFSSFSVPIAVANEYYDELANEYTGINLLPKYVKEDQKVLQFAWHGYALLPVLFAATFFITTQILNNNKEMGALDGEIAEQTILLRQNQELLNQIAGIESKIGSFDRTQAILDSASVGTGVWTNNLAHISDFFAIKENIWTTRLSAGADAQVSLEGYSISKDMPTQFAYSIQAAQLKSMYSENLRENSAYKFNINYKLSSQPKADK